MITHERVPTATNGSTGGAINMSLSASSSNCSELFIEEKKSADDGDFLEAFQRELAIEKRYAANAAAGAGTGTVWRNMISNGTCRYPRICVWL